MLSLHFLWLDGVCLLRNFHTCTSQQPHSQRLQWQPELQTNYAVVVGCSRSCCMNSVGKDWIILAIERMQVFGSCESWCMSSRYSLRREPIASIWLRYSCCTQSILLLEQLRVSSFFLH